jgi:hypothetical protein
LPIFCYNVLIITTLSRVKTIRDAVKAKNRTEPACAHDGELAMSPTQHEPIPHVQCAAALSTPPWEQEGSNRGAEVPRFGGHNRTGLTQPDKDHEKVSLLKPGVPNEALGSLNTTPGVLKKAPILNMNAGVTLVPSGKITAYPSLAGSIYGRPFEPSRSGYGAPLLNVGSHHEDIASTGGDKRGQLAEMFPFSKRARIVVFEFSLNGFKSKLQTIARLFTPSSASERVVGFSPPSTLSSECLICLKSCLILYLRALSLISDRTNATASTVVGVVVSFISIPKIDESCRSSNIAMHLFGGLDFCFDPRLFLIWFSLWCFLGLTNPIFVAIQSCACVFPFGVTVENAPYEEGWVVCSSPFFCVKGKR